MLDTLPGYSCQAVQPLVPPMPDIGPTDATDIGPANATGIGPANATHIGTTDASIGGVAYGFC